MHAAPVPPTLATPSDGLTLFRRIAFKRFTRRGRPVVEPRCASCLRPVQVVGEVTLFPVCAFCPRPAA